MILAGGNKDERLDLSNNSKLEQTRQAAMVVFKKFLLLLLLLSLLLLSLLFLLFVLLRFTRICRWKRNCIHVVEIMIFLDERITNRQADRQTEKPSNRDAKMQLKLFYGRTVI